MKEPEKKMSRGELFVAVAQTMNILPRGCPECAEKVQAFAVKCPHCQSAIPDLDNSQMRKIRKVTGVVTLVVATLALLVIYVI